MPSLTLTLTPDAAIHAVAETHGIIGSRAHRLGSEHASTFRLESDAGVFALKIQRSDPETAPLQSWRARIGSRLAELGHPVPPLVPDRSGEPIAFVRLPPEPGDIGDPSAPGARRRPSIAVQLAAWIDAVPYGAAPVATGFGERLGRAAGRLHRDLARMPAPPAPVSHTWDARTMAAELRAHLPAVDDPEVGRIAEAALALHERLVRPVAGELPLALVHQDLHDSNVLIDRRGGVAAVLDFDDMLVGWRVAEPAIAAAYLARNLGDPGAALASVVRGWSSEAPLEPAEERVLAPLAAMRLALNSTVWSTRGDGERGDYARSRARGSVEAFLALAEAASGVRG
ncbi:phosphotransferase [Leucobacter weissii]|uniref:Phosphotransferase n=1 Tax=Leucobacter weissii TaxID=1983706 RepID=A0A939SAC8_9MICO|nr:phosphotransferase [Leucobacter weissii]MBO1900340.1 phosphotransferase [Leucobacter weissii]